MKMIGHQGPGKTTGLAVAQNTAQPFEQMIADGAVPANLPALDPSNDNVMQHPPERLIRLCVACKAIIAKGR